MDASVQVSRGLPAEHRVVDYQEVDGLQAQVRHMEARIQQLTEDGDIR